MVGYSCVCAAIRTESPHTCAYLARTRTCLFSKKHVRVCACVCACVCVCVCVCMIKEILNKDKTETRRNSRMRTSHCTKSKIAHKKKKEFTDED